MKDSHNSFLVRCQIVVAKHENKKDARVELGKRWRELINRTKDPWHTIDRIAMVHTLREIDAIRACFFRYKNTGEFFEDNNLNK
jgi:hypothetical protein